MPEITQEEFQIKHKVALGAEYNRALEVFRFCTPYSAWKFSNLMEKSQQYGLVDRVLDIMEEGREAYLDSIDDEILKHSEIWRLIDVIYGDLFAPHLAAELSQTSRLWVPPGTRR